MTSIDMTNWSFSFGGSNAAFVGTPHYSPPTVLAFPTTLDLLLHLAGNGTHQPEIQSGINRRLKADSATQAWHRQRAYLKDMSHFPKYKGRHYDAYHAAARAVASKGGTTKQQAMATGLNQEIAASKVIAPAGQQVLHGRSAPALHSGATYPSFISTSLDPVVAVNSAMRRAGVKQDNGRPVVYILTLRDPLNVVWGNGGKPHEWELLMETNLVCSHVKTHSGTRFDIVEATIGR
jgi:hypothetical protein